MGFGGLHPATLMGKTVYLTLVTFAHLPCVGSTRAQHVVCTLEGIISAGRWLAPKLPTQMLTSALNNGVDVCP